MFRIEKRLSSFFRKNSLRIADFKKWTLHKTYDSLADAVQAYETMTAKPGYGMNWRIVSGDTVVKQKNK
jgi:hypothetical protein